MMIQMEAVECGAISLAIILGYYGKYPPIEELRIECGVSRDGSSAYNLLEAAKKYGLTGKAERKSAMELRAASFPAILFWEYRHFLVLEGFGKKQVYLNDPATGPRRVSYEVFEEKYSQIALFFSPGKNFVPGGRPPSFGKQLYLHLKKVPHPMLFLIVTGLCLLLPGFIIPACLMIFIETFFHHSIFPWEGKFLSVVLGVSLFTAALTWIQNFFLNRLNQKLSILFSSNFLWHLLQLPIPFYTQRYTGEIAYRMNLNEQVAQSLTGPFISTTISLVLVIFYACVLFAYDSAIALIGLLGGLFNLVTMFFLFRDRAIDTACLQQDLGKSVAESVGGLQNIEAIKAKGIESDFFSRWAGYYTKTVNARQKLGKKDIWISTVQMASQMLILSLLLGIGAMRIIEGFLSVSSLMSLQLLMSNFLRPIYLFVGFSSSLQNMKIDMNRLEDVMKHPIDLIYQKRRISSATIKTSRLSGHLEFRDVSFHYSPLSEPTIHSLSLTIKPGQKIAVIGATGSGKSTIAKLACGLYYPSSGQILYDGIPIEKVPIDLFRSSIASVDQEIFLFTGTIRENLTLWNRKIPDEILIAATKDAYIHEEILLRPAGYDTPLLEGGQNISGGQKQRIEIARALIYNPALLILDEATSAIDSTTEGKILERLQQKAISILMIAHRLSTVRDCQEIIVLDKGIVIERGSHEELKAKKGAYFELLQGEVFHG